MVVWNLQLKNRIIIPNRRNDLMIMLRHQEVDKTDSNNTDKNNTEISYTYDQSINPLRTDF